MSHDESKLHAPFDPDGGAFAENIRSIISLDDTELEQSLKKFGWVEHLPAFKDENDVVIVGHRRLKIAEKLNIEPVVKTLRFGKGDEADADRLKLAIASNLGFKPLTAGDRKRIAQYLYGKDEWTMQRIANALNVSEATIHRDLNSFTMKELKPAKTASNPKGAGRPKGSGSKPKRRKNDEAVERTVAALVLDDGLSYERAAAEAGLAGSVQVVKTAVAREEGRREVLEKEPPIDASTLSLSAQEKLAAAIRQHTRKLDQQFEERVRDEVKKRIDESTIPAFEADYKKYREWIEGRKIGALTKRAFNKIVQCLHPDRVQYLYMAGYNAGKHGKVDTQGDIARLQEPFEDAVRIMIENKVVILSEKDEPGPRHDLPSASEMMARRSAVRERNAERARAAMKARRR